MVTTTYCGGKMQEVVTGHMIVPTALIQAIGYKRTLLLTTIWAHQHWDGVCYDRIPELSEEVGWSDRTTQTHLSWLEKQGWITRRRVGWQGAYETRLTENAKAWFAGAGR